MVVEEGSSVVLCLSGSASLDYRWFSFAPDVVARGQHGGARGLERWRGASRAFGSSPAENLTYFIGPKINSWIRKVYI